MLKAIKQRNGNKEKVKLVGDPEHDGRTDRDVKGGPNWAR